MKASEIIRQNYDEIIETMVDSYDTVLRCDGRIEYQIYIWSDGEVEILQEAQGSNSWLKPKDSDERDLYYITTVSMPNFDPWDCIAEPKPDDEDEADEMVDWYIEEEVRCYKNEAARDVLDCVIDEYERDGN